MATVFVSPGVYTREQDFSVFASQIGITRLGLVGETTKGPAFEPIKISSTDEYLARFGTTDTRLQLPYVANSFLGQSQELTVTRVLGLEGFTNSSAWIIKAAISGGTHSGATLCVIRSKSADEGTTFITSSANAVQIAGITTTLAPFVLSGTTGPLTAITNSAITVSLDETRDDYIVKVLGKDPKKYSNDYGLYVESIYPHFIREAAGRGHIVNIAATITHTTDASYTDYRAQYQTPVTPYIVSKVAGGIVQDLFYFTSISDGDSANREIKISITNIDDVTKTFDVLVRSFNDTDSAIVTLERFRNCTLDSAQPNYIAKAIGTLDEEYPRRSNYILVTLATNHPENTVPAGFKGYTLRNASLSDVTNPNIYYKTTYFTGDSVFKTYLGVSELGYTGLTSTQTSVANSVKTLEADLFTYIGASGTGTTTIKGFHLENTAPSSTYETGAYNSISGYSKSERKFTLVPAGGFDGWNKFRNPDYTSAAIDANNVVALKQAIDTMENPEEVDINLFALPGCNYDDQEGVVKYALAMVENRADSLYIVDAPRLTEGTTKGTAAEAVSSLQDTGIDSNYAATYWPWLQINDQNYNKFVYISPTAEVVRAIALTDNVAYPWFAPAGYIRGVVSNLVQRADIKVNQDDRDALYADRINPIITSSVQGIAIFGQKTLQTKQSALDRVNVRRLLLQVRRLIAAASQTLLFEQNDATVRDQFLQKVEPILLQIQNQRGLDAFRVVLDSSPSADPNTLTGKIQLKPTPTLEFLDLTFQVLPQGAAFEDF